MYYRRDGTLFAKSVQDIMGDPQKELEFHDMFEGEKGAQYRRVDETYLWGVRISTVFLVIDHSFGGGKPVLFETMVFSQKKTTSKLLGHDINFHPSEFEIRYHTEEEAMAGHKKLTQIYRLVGWLPKFIRERLADKLFYARTNNKN